MIVGDIVVPLEGISPLRSGAEAYSYAICVSLNPFILISSDGDMRWSSTVKVENFKSFGPAPKSVMKVCMARLHHDQKEGTL